MEVMVIDQKGWSKSIKIEETITRVGTAPSNDIQVHSQKIAPVHLQFMFSPDLPSSSKVVNLAGQVVIKTNQVERQLSSFETIDLFDGDEIELGEFRLVLKIPLVAEYVQIAEVIGAVLSFPSAVLRPDYATKGQLTIQNKGPQTDCQFKVMVRGLPTDCCHIDPIPLLYPNAQEDVLIQLFSRGYYPEAGYHDVFFSITAPVEYPGEETIIKQRVYVVPIFDQRLEIEDDIVASSSQLEDGDKVIEPQLDLPQEETEMAMPRLPRSAVEVESGTRERTQSKRTLDETSGKITKSAEELDSKPQRIKFSEEKIPEQTQEPDRSEIKVIRNQFDDFWDE